MGARAGHGVVAGCAVTFAWGLDERCVWPSKAQVTHLLSLDNLELSARSQSDLDDQHDYDSVASDEDTDQEPLPSAGATRNNRARV